MTRTFCVVVCLWKLTTTFWSGDAFNVCHSRLPRDVTFDVISTSNLIDHVGLLNLLVTCQPRLKKYARPRLALQKTRMKLVRIKLKMKSATFNTTTNLRTTIPYLRLAANIRLTETADIYYRVKL